jgi:hypothetical protein
MNQGLVTISKLHKGCVGVLVPMQWPAMCTGKRLTYKNLLLKAQLSQAGLQATSTLLWIFSLSGHLVLSQDSSF